MNAEHNLEEDNRIKTDLELKVVHDSSTSTSSPAADASLFQELLKCKLKKGLKPTSTKLTKTDGSVIFLEHQGQDTVVEETTSNKSLTSIPHQSGYGFFVVDTKPDLTLGKIRPWLFISSQDVPSDIGLISEHGITRILSLLPGFELINSVKPLIQSHMVLDVFDEINFDLNSPTINDALDYIQESNLQNERLLVHCNAGLSRAPSIVMLYLMKIENLDFDTAFNQVKSVRPFAKPNEGFLRQLKSFHM